MTGKFNKGIPNIKFLDDIPIMINANTGNKTEIRLFIALDIFSRAMNSKRKRSSKKTKYTIELPTKKRITKTWKLCNSMPIVNGVKAHKYIIMRKSESSVRMKK